jgi:hypothetical protein
MHFVRENEMEKIPEIIKKHTGHGKKIFCQETKQIFDNLEQAA